VAPVTIAEGMRGRIAWKYFRNSVDGCCVVPDQLDTHVDTFCMRAP
jgi:hypothetical protein